MKKVTTVVALALGISTLGMAAEFTGFVEDSNCASKPAMKDDGECAKKCINGGAAAVLVTADGKVYKIANQDKIKSHAGEKVTVTGDAKGDTLTVASVK